jgi:2,3-dihydroxybenzoate decarboxylase
MKKIALEEHFYIEGFPHPTRENRAEADPTYFAYADPRLPDVDNLRITDMDRAGIEIAVLSHFAPGPHGERDAAKANAAAQKGNDGLAGIVARHPTRYRGFAMLAMHHPKAAADELERSVKELGFVGALLNGQTQGFYYDDPRYLPFWERVAALGVPIYLHPGHPQEVPAVYQGYRGLNGAVWGWMAETGGHALRLVMSGLFDRLPTLTIIIGHMGESLPYSLWRIDSRYAIGRHKVTLQHKPSHYIRGNFVITTAGVFDPVPLACAIAAMGEDRVLFSVDYPLEYSDEAARFIEDAPMTEARRQKICWDNAARVLKI